MAGVIHPFKGDAPWREGLALGLLALVLLLAMDGYVRDSPAPRNDELIYKLMAQRPFEPHTFPFAYRVAVPTLVHILPFEHEFSFSALAWLFTAGCGTLAYVLLRRFDIGKPLAAGLGLSLPVLHGGLASPLARAEPRGVQRQAPH